MPSSSENKMYHQAIISCINLQSKHQDGIQHPNPPKKVFKYCCDQPKLASGKCG